jgi:transcriptional regulator with XRE-family HTH domain
MNTEYDTLEKRVRVILELRGWSARELSRRCQMRSQSHVNMILHGGVPGWDTVARIAAAAQVSISWLMTGIGLPTGFGGDLIPPPLPPAPGPPRPPLPQLPAALSSALADRQVSESMTSCVERWHARGATKRDWEDFIDALELTCRLFDHRFVDRARASHEKVVAKSVVGVARSQMSRRGAEGASPKPARRR